MNFYVVGNVLNTNFFKYYLQNVLKINIDNNKPFTYNLELIDHNLKILNLDESQSIIIRKNNYDIIEPNKMNTNVKDVATSEVENLIEEVLKKIADEPQHNKNNKNNENNENNKINSNNIAFEPSTVIY
jgi:hypothetical protein